MLEQGNLTADDYDLLFAQTGLGRLAVDKLWGENPQRLLELQENYFAQHYVQCDPIGPVSYEETFYNEKGPFAPKFEIVDYKKGDVVLTRSTHTFGWRHGHAGLVVDDVNGYTLEAITLGEDSILQYLSKWQGYPTFIQLRLKDAEKIIDGQRLGDLVADSAMANLKGIRYGILSDILSRGDDIEDIKSTHCSRLVWQAFEPFGYNIDSDKGLFVTPKDIADSDLFEVVQVYGLYGDPLWK